MAGQDALTETQARKIVQDIMERAGGDEVLRCPSSADFLKEWIEHKRASKAPGTVARYAKTVKEFLADLSDRTGRPLSSLTPRAVQGFVTRRSALGLSPATVSLDAKVLRTAFTRARRLGLILTNPAEAIELPADDPVTRAPFTPNEVRLLVDAAEGEWKTLILLGYLTGARMGDCCRMPWDALNLAEGTLTYQQKKTGEPVTLPLHGELQEHLESIAASDRPEKSIMPGMAGKGSGGQHGLSEGFKAIMRRAGIDRGWSARWACGPSRGGRSTASGTASLLPWPMRTWRPSCGCSW